MPPPADPALIAAAVRLVADGASYSESARAVGASPQAVRIWALRSGVASPTARLPLDAWEASEVSQDLRDPENAGESILRGSQGNRLYVGWTTGDELDGYRPSERDVRDPVALGAAMRSWRSRVAETSAVDFIELNVRSSFHADVERR